MKSINLPNFISPISFASAIRQTFPLYGIFVSGVCVCVLVCVLVCACVLCLCVGVCVCVVFVCAHAHSVYII